MKEEERKGKDVVLTLLAEEVAGLPETLKNIINTYTEERYFKTKTFGEKHSRSIRTARSSTVFKLS
jgi:hypothetical protein